MKLLEMIFIIINQKDFLIHISNYNLMKKKWLLSLI